MIRASYGFTLVELLVALFITAILFTMGYGAINQTLAHRGAIEEQQERLLAVQTTMRMMAQDFGQMTPRPVREPVGSDWQPVILANGTSQGQTQSGPLVTLTRTGWANPAGIQRPALQRVSYIFEKDTLRREYQPVLDPTLANQPAKRELLSGIKSIQFRYMDNLRQWVDHWPAQAPSSNDPGSAQRTRPMAVEVTVELEDWGKVIRLFEVPQ
jgi:general secretion pathway protein J